MAYICHYSLGSEELLKELERSFGLKELPGDSGRFFLFVALILFCFIFFGGLSGGLLGIFFVQR